jgi:lipoyl(octanoyl) transferase
VIKHIFTDSVKANGQRKCGQIHLVKGDADGVLRYNIAMEKWCGTVSYAEGLRLQQEAFTSCRERGESTLLGLEHATVITLGKRLQSSQAEVKFQPPGVDVQFTDRGGEATLHSPGQLVVYPVIDIRSRNMSVRDYVCWLEKALVATLREYGLETKIIEGQPGVYTSQGKIAFLGIRVKQGITQHGLSLNVCNDLTLFNWIRPCGKDIQSLDSLSLHGINATPKEVFAQLSGALMKAFHLTKEPLMKDSQTSISCTALRP